VTTTESTPPPPSRTYPQPPATPRRGLPAPTPAAPGPSGDDRPRHLQQQATSHPHVRQGGQPRQAGSDLPAQGRGVDDDGGYRRGAAHCSGRTRRRVHSKRHARSKGGHAGECRHRGTHAAWRRVGMLWREFSRNFNLLFTQNFTREVASRGQPT
jgi:hypothetical protein